jgi:hypothetical protein
MTLDSSLKEFSSLEAAEEATAGFIRLQYDAETSPSGKIVSEVWQGVYRGHEEDFAHEGPYDVLTGPPHAVQLVLERKHPLEPAYMQYAHQAGLSHVRYIPPHKESWNSNNYFSPRFWIFHEVYCDCRDYQILEDVVQEVGSVIVGDQKLADTKEDFDSAEGYFVEHIVRQWLGSNNPGWGRKKRSRYDDNFVDWCRIYYDEAKGRRVANMMKGVRKVNNALMKDDLERFVKHLASDVSSSYNGFGYRNEGVEPTCYRMDGCVDDLDRVLGLHAMFYGRYAYRHSSWYDRLILKVHGSKEQTFKKWKHWPVFLEWLERELRCREAKRIIRNAGNNSYKPLDRRYCTGFDLYKPKPPRRKRRLPPLPDFVSGVKQSELISAQGMLR